MAGLYDRMASAGLDGQGSDRVDVHLTTYGIAAYVGGTWSKNQIIDGVNTVLARSGWIPLRAEDLTDLDSIIDVVDLKTTNTQKLIYATCQIEPTFSAAELDLISDTQWRASLEI